MLYVYGINLFTTSHIYLWQSHIDYVYNKIIKFTCIFYKIRDKINFDVAKIIHFAFIHSHLAYGIEIYGNTYTNHLNRLTILNNKLLRILQNAPHETPVVKLYANFNALTLPAVSYTHLTLPTKRIV